MTVFAPIVPAVSVLLLVLLSVMPWGFGPSVYFALPLLPFAAVHFWTRAQVQLMPASFVFATGLAVDVLSYGPLGYWPLVYLGGVGLMAATDRLGAPGRVADWLGFSGVMAGLALVAWLLASVYFMRFIDWRPMAWAAVLLALIYPALQAVLSPLDRWVAGPRALNLERRI